MAKRIKAKNEFRYNNSTKHPNYVFGESGSKYHSVGLTHNKTTFGKANMPLSKNPDNRKKETTYVRNGIITDKKNNYSKKPIKNMSFEKSDFAKVKSKIRHYKKGQRKNK